MYALSQDERKHSCDSSMFTSRPKQRQASCTK